MKNLISFLLYLGISTLTKAQLFFNEGTITTKDKRQKEGKIKQIDNQTIKFIAENGEIQQLSVNELVSYSIEKTNYIKGNILLNQKTQTVFLKELITAYLSLYALPKPTDSLKFVIKKGQENVVLLSAKDASVTLRKTVTDANNNALIGRLTNNNFEYTRSFLSDIVKDYSKIMKPNDNVREPKTPFSYSVGVLVGFSSSTPTYTNYLSNGGNGILTSSNFTPVGINFTINPRKTLAVEIEALYNQYKGTRSFKYTSTAQNYTDILHFEEQSISVPIHLKFTFLQRPFATYFKVGPKYVIEKHVDGFIEKQSGQIMPIFSSAAHRFSGLGYNIGLGIEKKLTSKFIPKLEYRYSYHTIQDESVKVAQNSSHQIIFGFSIINK